MTIKRYIFKGSRGFKLAAKLDYPNNDEPRAYAIFAHCFTCSKDIRGIRNISSILTSRGIAVLRFDFTGLGESEGNFEDTDFQTNIDDILYASEFLKSVYKAPTFLLGQSMGGSAVIRAGHLIDSIKAVVALAAPYTLTNLTRLLTGKEGELDTNGIVQVNVAGYYYNLKKQFFDNLFQHNIGQYASELNKPLLLLHSPTDETVKYSDALKLFESASIPKGFISLEGTDHLLTNENHAAYAGNVIASWLERYLE